MGPPQDRSTDGRYTLAMLTEDGWDKVVASASGHVVEVRRLVLDPLTKTRLANYARSAPARSTPLAVAHPRPRRRSALLRARCTCMSWDDTRA